MYSEVFGSRECDCGWQLKTSRELLTVQGGVLIYLDQEGRGAGLRAKANAYLLNNQEGLDTYQAYDRLGLASDLREYADAVQILNELGLASVRLLTNNPSKVEALEKAGINVARVPLQARPTPTTVAYLKAKKRHGHLLLPLSLLTSPRSYRTIVAIGDFSLTAVRGQSGDTARKGVRPCPAPQRLPTGRSTSEDFWQSQKTPRSRGSP
jgi:3,4-dihydroxy 2-butanone 4-phosphate synthase/GTP cyclohydrolase II